MNSLSDYLSCYAKNQPEKPALVFYDEAGERHVLSYRRLNKMVNAFAKKLQYMNVELADVVTMCARNSPSFIIAMYACFKIGAVFTGLNARATEYENSEKIRMVEPKVIIAQSEFLNMMRNVQSEFQSEIYMATDTDDKMVLPDGWLNFDNLVGDGEDEEPDSEVESSDIAFLVFTSGTEGFPKAVIHTHDGFLSGIVSAAEVADVTKEDKCLLMAPFHTMAMMKNIITVISTGATIVSLSSKDHGKVLDIIEKESVTHLTHSATFFLALTEHDAFKKANLQSLKRCMAYAGLISPQLNAKWRNKAPNIKWQVGWGQSELGCSGTVGIYSDLDDVPGHDPAWVGRAYQNMEFRIVDENGNDSDVGEIICRASTVCKGYYKNPSLTEKLLKDGWLHSEDILRKDESGNLFFVDRKKDIIKSGGFNVSSLEVESVLSKHPKVSRAAVIGVKDEKWGETVTAAVVAAPGTNIDAEEIKAFCKIYLSDYKAPKRVCFIDKLPTDVQGKVLKRELRKIISAQAK